MSLVICRTRLVKQKRDLKSNDNKTNCGHLRAKSPLAGRQLTQLIQEPRRFESS